MNNQILMRNPLSELVEYSSMVKSMVRREIRGRYKGSILGFLWNFLTPLAQILVYIIVFSIVFKPNIDNYAIYLTIGMILWIFFSETLCESSHVLVSNSDLLKKIYFPRMVLPLSTVLSKFVNFLIMLVIYFVIALITGYGIDPLATASLLLFIPIFVVFLFGLGLLLSSINVYLRDVEYMTTVTMMFLVWLCPIMYSRAQFESGFLDTLLSLNPMTYFVDVFHDILYLKCIPDPLDLVICLIIACVAFLLGILVFNYLEKDFAEVI